MADHNPAARVDLDALELSAEEIETLEAVETWFISHNLGKSGGWQRQLTTGAASTIERILADHLAPLMAELRDARERASRYAREANLADDRCDRLSVLADKHYARAERAEAERDEARAARDEARETLLTIRRYAEAQAITHRAQFGFDGRQWLDVLAILDRAALADRGAS
jgi:hypothetical protein